MLYTYYLIQSSKQPEVDSNLIPHFRDEETKDVSQGHIVIERSNLSACSHPLSYLISLYNLNSNLGIKSQSEHSHSMPIRYAFTTH